MSVKRSFATGRVAHFNHDKFPVIAGQWKTFENLASDTRKTGLLGACPTVATFTHWTSSLVKRRVDVPRSDRDANDYGGLRRSNKVCPLPFYMSVLGSSLRSPEGGDKAAGFLDIGSLDILPGQAAVIDRIALRQRPGGKQQQADWE
jgi:hypothetical protein